MAVPARRLRESVPQSRADSTELRPIAVQVAVGAMAVTIADVRVIARAGVMPVVGAHRPTITGNDHCGRFAGAPGLLLPVLAIGASWSPATPVQTAARPWIARTEASKQAAGS